MIAIPENTAVDLGPYTCENPEGASGGCAAITDYSGMVYDHHDHQMLMFGGGHAGATGTLRSDVSAFDFAELQWKSAYTPTSCAEMRFDNIDPSNASWISTGQPLARHTYDMLVMGDDPPHLLMLTSGAVGPETCSGPMAPPGFSLQTKVSAYDPVARTWKYHSTSTGDWDSFSVAELDPVSGMVAILGSYGLWIYDPRKDAFAGSKFLPVELGYANNLVYSSVDDRMYYFMRGDSTRVFELALHRDDWGSSTLTELTGVVGGPATLETGYAYDTLNHVIGGAVVDGRFSAFDPVKRTWTTVEMKTEPPGAKVGTLAFHEIAYDPVDGVFLFITDYPSGFHVWAYRYAGTPPAPPGDGGLGDGGGVQAPPEGAPPEGAGDCGCRLAPPREFATGAVTWGLLIGALTARARRRSSLPAPRRR
ncbi:hypothetical protein [Polyangium aurulentum]|uniref:hypothetical protein n=1 Tax=Polyangium aurulentum TaxID=2567896 RepID=UPI00146D4674|nr:hypothetical protein [Polyangium aurulentum]UQA60473.1 hypothetical protein E8A73_008375 [Polyangium aurulentum]